MIRVDLVLFIEKHDHGLHQVEIYDANHLHHCVVFEELELLVA